MKILVLLSCFYPVLIHLIRDDTSDRGRYSGFYETSQTVRELKFFQLMFYDIKQHENVMLKLRIFRL